MGFSEPDTETVLAEDGVKPGGRESAILRVFILEDSSEYFLLAPSAKVFILAFSSCPGRRTVWPVFCLLVRVRVAVPVTVKVVVLAVASPIVELPVVDQLSKV